MYRGRRVRALSGAECRGIEPSEVGKTKALNHFPDLVLQNGGQDLGFLVHGCHDSEDPRIENLE